MFAEVQLTTCITNRVDRIMYWLDGMHDFNRFVVGPPPPSYTAAVGEAFNIKDEEDTEYTMGEATYAPQYTYYDWNQSAFTYNK